MLLLYFLPRTLSANEHLLLLLVINMLESLVVASAKRAVENLCSMPNVTRQQSLSYGHVGVSSNGQYLPQGMCMVILSRKASSVPPSLAAPPSAQLT